MVCLSLIPKQPSAEATVRVPAKFFGDHEERDCEPYCTPVKRSSRFVWLRPNDPGLDELLDDARHYAEPDQFGEWGRENKGYVRSAAATVKAIETARKAVQS
jgi:phenylpropionate dioxygenase-like ring-hydroxylating dioxygenase large terminal subunit